MSCLLYDYDEEADNGIDIDELYEKKHQDDLRQLSLFNKILNRTQKKIRATTKNIRNEKYIWFQIPDYLFGEPIYSHTDCIAFVVHKLQENGFEVTTYAQNWIFITWHHWIPFYVRDEYKRKTGNTMDELGNIKIKESAASAASSLSEASSSSSSFSSAGKKQFGQFDNNNNGTNTMTPEMIMSNNTRSTKSFKPGNFIYRDDLLQTMEKRFS